MFWLIGFVSFSLFIMTVFPMIYSFGTASHFGENLSELLQANNVAANSTNDCAFLEVAVQGWLKASSAEKTAFMGTISSQDTAFIAWAQLLPVRCSWQADDGVITSCPSAYDRTTPFGKICSVWDQVNVEDPVNATSIGDSLDRRPGAIQDFNYTTETYSDINGADTVNATFIVRVYVDENHTVSVT
jgi:hypothetical protein